MDATSSPAFLFCHGAGWPSPCLSSGDTGQQPTPTLHLKQEMPIPTLDRALSAARTRHPLLLKIAIAILLGGIIIVALASWYAGRIARRYLVASIESHYHSKVALKSFDVLVFPRIVIRGDDLVLRNTPDPDSPPFIRISRFTADTGIIDLLRKKKHIRLLTLEDSRSMSFTPITASKNPTRVSKVRTSPILLSPK
jgi:hypothetical protein